MKLLEVGRGNLPAFEQDGSLFANNMVEYTAIDICTLGRLPDSEAGAFIEADASSMPFPANTFDYVLMRNFFGQFCDGSTTPTETNRITKESLQEVHRVLSPLGHLAIIEEDTPLDAYDAETYLNRLGFSIIEFAGMSYGTDNINTDNPWKLLRSRYYSDYPAQSSPDEFLGTPYVLVAGKE